MVCMTLWVFNHMVLRFLEQMFSATLCSGSHQHFDSATTLSSTLAVTGAINASSTYTGGGLMTTGGNIVIPNAGNIGSVGDTDAIAIASGGGVTLSQKSIHSVGLYK